jgi:hypothetical protein
MPLGAIEQAVEAGGQTIDVAPRSWRSAKWAPVS